MTSFVKTETGESSHSDEGVTVMISTRSDGFQNRSTTTFSGVCEIEEESSSDLFEIRDGAPMDTIQEEIESGGLFSFDFKNGDDVVYVAVGKSEHSSMDALLWTLNHLVNPSSTIVYLIHVCPETRHIPTPLGKIPISQVNPEQKESYMIQERSKRREFLQRFIDTCSASKVEVDTVLIESDMEAKAILDLIPILNIKKLVLGTTKSNLRKIRSRRGSGIADQILQNAPAYCEVNIICEGKEAVDQLIESPSPRGGNDTDSPKPTQEPDQITDSFSCNCFKPKAIA
ncbi:unnamed protein product [Ilex paraguariensis]|uniref:Uncharacterized protein n=1 Tax=Ilex paraguariensis TaxID=185542 RepID=A0ABC8SP65_9AQUA